MIRLVVLWHMHQPYYKDLVTGEYRLPWVRLHALKDYFGMVKLLDEFPTVHQTFNLVPSLVAQIEDYASGQARDPFLDLAARPASDLTPDERRLALQYLFQANVTHMIGRYPRYKALWEKFRGFGDSVERADRFFTPAEFADLQVLSQLAWFDEYFLDEPDIAALVRKGAHFNADDQRLVIARQKDLLGRVLPAYAAAAARGSIEISTSPFYHPILPLLCDTDQGRVSAPNLPLPTRRFRHPEDAVEQLRRALDLHQRVFGRVPQGAWPSEGSVSEEVLALAHQVGLKWMATDEGVLGRSLGIDFRRSHRTGQLDDHADKLYSIYRYEKDAASIHLLFRDHMLSDLIGFVYSGMPPRDAAADLVARIKAAARPAAAKGMSPVVPIILDGENAWEYYPKSGREFLRRFCDAVTRDPEIEALTVSEAIARQDKFPTLKSLVPGSWINANFNVWIGAPEDNRAWDYLGEARDFFADRQAAAHEPARRTALEEILIAEGSDWNWWYGPEHHSANDRDFDELYRKHLSNVYQLLGATPPDELAQPITREAGRPYYMPQTAFIHPRIEGDTMGYFDWIGAAMYTADRRSSAMHGKSFLLDAVYAGVDENNLYARVDFVPGVALDDLILSVHCEQAAPSGDSSQPLRLEVTVERHAVSGWKLTRGENGHQVSPQTTALQVRMRRIFEMKLPLAEIPAPQGSRIRLRFSLWREGLPVDALPLEGSLDLDVISEAEMAARY
jgi:alpha-amylase/alpha-mannosidase (GH57 family)